MRTVVTVVSEEDMVYLLVIDDRQQVNARAEKKRKHSVLVKALVNPSPPVLSTHCISLASRCTVIVHTISI